MLTVAIAAILILARKRTTVPAAVAGQSVFPGTRLLNELLVIAGVLLLVALADHAMAAGLRRIAKGLAKRCA